MSSVNAGPQYFAAERKYSEARTPEEKLAALMEMMKYAPKHKASENLRREITKKIAAVKNEIEKQKAAKKGSGIQLHVKKEGAGQIVLVGMPNSGKSTLLNKLTGLNVEVADYPFTTKKPEVGMMNYKGALVQIVEVPAIIEGSSEGKADGLQLLSIVRNADAIIIVARNEHEEKIVKNELLKANIKLNEEKPNIEIKRSKFKGITISGKHFLKFPEKELIDYLKGIGYYNAEVKIASEINDLSKVIEAMDERITYKKCLVVNPFEEKLEGKELEALKEKIFLLLDKIIIYTKKPGEEADLNEPLVLKRGATVEDVAKHLHKELAKNLRYVRVWGSTKFAGQRVAKEYRLASGDIIEIYA